MSDAAGSSTASPDAGASQEQHQDVGVPDVSTEGASRAVRIKEPAPIYGKQGEAYEPPKATIDAIESFK